MTSIELPYHEHVALCAIVREPITVGVLDTEEKIAAALTLASLEAQGYARRETADGAQWPTILVTDAGRSAHAVLGDAHIADNDE